MERSSPTPAVDPDRWVAVLVAAFLTGAVTNPVAVLFIGILALPPEANEAHAIALLPLTLLIPVVALCIDLWAIRNPRPAGWAWAGLGLLVVVLVPRAAVAGIPLLVAGGSLLQLRSTALPLPGRAWMLTLASYVVGGAVGYVALQALGGG
jgi:hypothetical protein